MMILKLVDGGILEISSDRDYSPGGCETCDYGSEYVNQYIFQLTKGDIIIEGSTSYDYPISEGYMMKLMLSQVNTIKGVTEEQFCEWLYEQLDKEYQETITRYEWKNKK